VACIATSVSRDRIFAVALWSMIVLDYMVEIYEGFHYSVDMWLGIVLVTLLWHVLEPFEGSSRAANGASRTPTDQALSKRKQKGQPLSTRYLVAYIIPGLGAYLQIIVIPQQTANIMIVFYALSGVVVYIQFAAKASDEYTKQFYVHYAQHILLCLLFMALGIYL
jgi:hypothetical protein